MEDNTQEQDISFVTFEKRMLKLQRKNRRLFVAAVILLVLIAVSNAAWVLFILS